jgi:hypothetical protein
VHYGKRKKRKRQLHTNSPDINDQAAYISSGNLPCVNFHSLPARFNLSSLFPINAANMQSDIPPWKRASTRPGPRSSTPSKRSAEEHDIRGQAKRSVEAQEKAWVADEGRFALAQAKKRAALRVKGGRAAPIDWLAVALRIIDPERNPLDDEIDDEELDMVDPEGVLEGLDERQLSEIEADIDQKFLPLESNRDNVEYWNTIKTICRERRRKSHLGHARARAVDSVSADVDKLLKPKTYEQLETLEVQINKKLKSKEPIDFDYWEDLRQNVLVYKAKAKLRRISEALVTKKLSKVKKQQAEEAETVQDKLRLVLNDVMTNTTTALSFPALDPEPFLKIPVENKGLDIMDESTFLDSIAEERQKTIKLGYIPTKQRNTAETAALTIRAANVSIGGEQASRFAVTKESDFSTAATALYEREVARGVGENEEIFAGEEELSKAQPQWADKYRPRKPRYFNRVQMGYEWNKYNQTHYDHDNPPPKVVQGYKFNIFYPDLIDKTRAPTYKIEREHGRKRGQSFAAAGEEDTCIIRFIAGPPYEDVAFRIVDKEWDYSAKRERGFKSSFDKGILQLHFQFKKIYYRK